MPDFIYPTSVELYQIEQYLLPRLTQDRLGFTLMPMVNRDASQVEWDVLDDFKGLQQARGLGGAPARVQAIGQKTYSMKPGYYGEFIPIDEEERVTRRQIGSLNAPINVESLVMTRQQQLLQRRLDRLEYIIWLLLSTGTFAVAAPNGAVVHTDTFPIQTFSAATAWSTSATSTPLADFRSVQILDAGFSVNFGAGAMAIMNRPTYNRMISNTNNADLYGRRTKGLATINNIKELNELLTEDDLPTVVIYNAGYKDDSGTWQRYIATGKVVVVGQRRGVDAVGKYIMTRNGNRPDHGPGAFTEVIRQVAPPHDLEVHDSHAGGPALEYPFSVVAMNV